MKSSNLHRVEEPEENIHHDSNEKRFINFFKNLRYNIVGVTKKATIVWICVYTLAVVMNFVADKYSHIAPCENGKFQTCFRLENEQSLTKHFV